MPQNLVTAPLLSSKTRRRVSPLARALLGWCTLVALLALLASAVLGALSTPTLVLGCVLDALVALFNAAQVVRLAYLVFGTQGRGHYELSPWRLIDSLLCHVCGQTAAALALWKASAAAGVVAFSHTTSTSSSFYALYDILVYASVLYGGGGIIDNAPLSEAARALTGLQWVWQSVSILVFFAGALAVVQNHTDEDSPKSLN